MQKCNKCRNNLPLTAFYSREPWRRGYYKVCKECMREYNLTDGHKEACQNWRADNPQAHKAYRAVNHAIAIGELERPDNCSNCGAETEVEAHHESYDAPLDVLWLCPSCHGLTRRKITA